MIIIPVHLPLLSRIVIYDYDGIYDETIIMDCMSTYFLNLLSSSMSMCSRKDNCYIFIPSNYVIISDAGDIYIYIYIWVQSGRDTI